MMIDVDSLTRRFGNLTAQYVKITTLLSYHAREYLPAAYTGDLHSVPKATNVPATNPIPTLLLLTLTGIVINGVAGTVK